MNDKDFQPFVREFKRVALALDPYKRRDEELDAKASAYFDVLKVHDLLTVCAKADAWLATEAKMPKPAEWAGIIPKRPTADVRVLTDAEAREFRDAEQLGYEGDPCGCALCVHAGVDEKPLRFVPDLDRNDRDIRVRDGNRIVTAGHWAHGAELAGYYRARSDFWETCYAKGLMGREQKATAEKVPLVKRLELIFAKAMPTP